MTEDEPKRERFLESEIFYYDEIAYFPPELRNDYRIIEGGIGRGERKHLEVRVALIRTTAEEGFIERGYQWIYEPLGPTHEEEIKYNRIPPQFWKNDAKLVLSCEENRRMRKWQDEMEKKHGISST